MAEPIKVIIHHDQIREFMTKWPCSDLDEMESIECFYSTDYELVGVYYFDHDGHEVTDTLSDSAFSSSRHLIRDYAPKPKSINQDD